MTAAGWESQGASGRAVLGLEPQRVATRVIDAWLSDADAREAASRAALAFAATHGGATARTVEAVASLVLPTL